MPWKTLSVFLSLLRCFSWGFSGDLGSVHVSQYAPEFEEVFLLAGVDANEDGEVSYAELEAAHGPAKAKALMRYDADRSGILERSELARMASDFSVLTRSGGQDAEERDSSSSQHELPFDEDRDGSLSREEVAKHFGEEEAEDVFWLLDDDGDGRLESHEILGALASADGDGDGQLDADELQNTGGGSSGKRSLPQKFLSKFRKFARLTPKALVRKFWSVLKDLECVCPEARYATVDDLPSGAEIVYDKSRRPCLIDVQLEMELEQTQQTFTMVKCDFPKKNAEDGNSTTLTAAEFQRAARETLIPIDDVYGDMSYANFKSFIQRSPSYVTAAIAHLIDAGGFAMARSMLVQQIAVHGMALHMPTLVKDAAARRYQLANKAATQKFLFDRATAKLVTMALQLVVFITVIISGLCYWRYSNIEDDSGKIAAGGDKPINHASEYQLTRAYLSGFYARDEATKTDDKKKKGQGDDKPEEPSSSEEAPTPKTKRVDLARLLLFRTPALWNMKNGGNIISDRTWQMAFEKGVADSANIDDPDIFNIASASLNDLNERRLRLW